METLWFCLAAFLIAGYVVLDGFDIGAGMLHLWVARGDTERRQVLAAVGPFWDGNEVWLLAAGGTLYFAFPSLYAASFSGFYLPLIMVLWLLIWRALSIEFRGTLDKPLWTQFWDAGFTLASTALAVFFGAALGNVIRGVPLDGQADFFLPLWTHFDIRGEVGILDWYTIPVGVLAALALAMHGGLWVSYKTGGDLQERAQRCARWSAYGVVALTVGVTLATFRVQPQVPANFSRYPWGGVFPALALAGLGGVFWCGARNGRELRAFLASCAYITGMLASAAFGIYPNVLPSNGPAAGGLTIYNAATAPYGLRIGLMWWLPGMVLAVVYAFFLYRKFAGKVDLSEAGHCRRPPD